MLRTFSALFFPSILCCLLLSSCGKSKKDVIVVQSNSAEISSRWVALPAEISVDKALMENADAYKDIQVAAAFWEKKLGSPAIQLKKEPYTGVIPPFEGDPLTSKVMLANVIYIQDPWIEGADLYAAQTVLHARGGFTFFGSILVNPNVHVCFRDCLFPGRNFHGQPDSWRKTSFRRLIAHEMGHFLGLNHSPDRSNVMYKEIQPGSSLDTLEVDENEWKRVTR